ncbi:ATP-binding cassette domain-containing protein [Longibaculum muris]|uniref:ATP-binding cassette domain-containing protein n=1 Tax=Longibaculum muris TaxID=1796628 RepID=UPI0022E63F37|nr:ATP-binding cassette domain-containing protein [Longibaculum muris]
MIKVQDLSFSYSQLTIFEEVSFSFYSHHITVIKGESGSGKTTLLDLLSLRYGVCFDMEYNGQSIVHNEVQMKYLKNLYYMQQECSFNTELKIKDYWSLLESIYGQCSNLDFLIQQMGLEKEKDLYPAQLSGGEKLRASFVAIAIMKPQIILMDEPTASLNIEYKIKLLELLQNLKKDCHIIIATHDSYIIDNADMLYTIDNHDLILQDSTLLDNNKISKIKNREISLKKNWLNIFMKMKKHHIFKETITLLLMSFAITLCAFSINVDNGFFRSFETNLETLENRNILVYKGLDPSSPGFNGDMENGTYFPITSSELATIQNIPSIASMSPKIILHSYIDERVSKSYPSTQIIKDNQIIYDYQNTIDKELKESNSNFFTLFIDKMNNQEKEKYISEYFRNHEEDGIYLTKQFMIRCGLTIDNLKDASIKMNIAIPMYDVSGKMQFSGSTPSGIETSDDDFLPANYIECTSKELVLPILGVVEHDLEGALTEQDATFYMNDQLLEKIAQSCMPTKEKSVYLKDSAEGYVETRSLEDADLVEVYTPWRPNAYTVEVDKTEHIEKVVDELESKGLTVDWRYNDYQSIGESMKNTKTTLYFISIASVIFVTFIYGIIHFIKGKDEKNFNQWLRSIGYLQKKDILKIKIQKYFINALLLAIISYIMLWVVVLISAYVYYQPYIIDFNSVLVIFTVAFIIQLVVPMLWEVLSND